MIRAAIDPTRTTLLRRKFSAEMRRRFSRLKRALFSLLVEEDALGLLPRTLPDSPLFSGFTGNTSSWAILSPELRIQLFTRWLQSQLEKEILQRGGVEVQNWLEEYLTKAYLGGTRRAVADSRIWTGVSASPSVSQPFLLGLQAGLLQQSPLLRRRLRLLATGSYTDLRGVADTASAQVTRELISGINANLSPRDIARNMGSKLDKLLDNRALLIVSSGVVASYNEGILDTLEALGVEEANVMVELRTASDGKVCPECRPLARLVMKVKDSHGFLPRHPRCRCAFVPANVGESRRWQKRGKLALRKAVRQSIAAEFPSRTLEESVLRTTWPGAKR